MEEFLGRKTMSFHGKGMLKNYAVIPVVFVTFAGACFAGYYCTRLMMRNPDVALNRTKNPEPWQEYEKKQYKFFSWIDHDKYEHPRPKF